MLEQFLLDGKVAHVTEVSDSMDFAITSTFTKVGTKIVFNNIEQQAVVKDLSIQ